LNSPSDVFAACPLRSDSYRPAHRRENRRLTMVRASTCESAFWAHDVQDPAI
jgi:hypothetical protein